MSEPAEGGAVQANGGAPPGWDPAQTYLLADWPHESPQLCCRFGGGGRFAFAGAMDFSVRRWRLEDGQAVGFKGHDSWVRTLTGDPSGELLVSGGYDGRLVWWNAAAETPTAQRTVEAHRGWVRDVAISPDGQSLASAGNDGRVAIWSLADGKLMREFTSHGTQVHSVAFHPSGQQLFSGDLKGIVKQWDVSQGEELRQFDATPLYLYFGGQGVDFGGVRSLAVSPDGKFVAAGGTTDATNPLGAVHKPLAIVFDVATGERVQQHRAQENFDGVVWSLRYHPSGTLMGATGGGGGGHLLFWKQAEAAEFHKFALPVLARDMDLHSDGLRVLTTHSDGHTRLFQMSAKPA